MGKMESAVLAHRCMVAWGMLHVFRTNMGKLSLNVRGHLFTQAYLQNGYCVLSPVWSAKEAARLEMLGFLVGIPELQICSFILHNVAFCSNGRFKKHMKQLNEYVSCPHQATRRCAAFYRFMSLKVQYVRAVFWGDLDKNRRLFRM